MSHVTVHHVVARIGHILQATGMIFYPPGHRHIKFQSLTQTRYDEDLAVSESFVLFSERREIICLLPLGGLLIWLSAGVTQSRRRVRGRPYYILSLLSPI
ncbi:Uncharacterized protein HZ326_9829 [Fusarium oxysporum f. sp. albedinis]|jgi:hypothetical protein|nr:Uncharacterized protein HZ326_9829 [Fusarium oxysporum f. sp. albedinis]